MDILISGAGIAGPTLAYWLQQRGFRCTVVERAPAPRPGGQAVDLRGTGRQVVERMGLMERVRSVAVQQHGIAIVDRRGKAIARLGTEMFGGEGIVSEIEVLRGDLADVVYEATLPDVEYLFGDTVTALDEDVDGITATFENAPARRFALVIGADGLHSAVRKLAFGPESEYVRPLGCYTAWFTAPAAPDLDGWLAMHNEVGGRVVSLRPGRLPGESKAGLSFRSEPLALDRRDAAAVHAAFAERFRDVGWKAGWLVDAMRDAPDVAFEYMGQVHMDRWHTGRVALLGDAGYSPSPLTGLGTSLALVGAYVLAGELAAAGGDHTVAFPRYEQVLRPYVTSGQELPPMGIDGFAPRTRLALTMSRSSMKWMTRWPLRLLAERFFAKASEIALPDYPRSLVSDR
ncbi:FAD-dependent monooxygenase [Actinomycetes bacterium KLBMP 9759]